MEKNLSKNRKKVLTWSRILKLLEDYKWGAEVARQIKRSRQYVYYQIKELLQYGYIRDQIPDARSYPKFYVITEKGQNLMENWKRQGRHGIRFHHFALKCRIDVDNPNFLSLSSRRARKLKGGVVQVDGEVDDFNVRRWHSPNGDWLYLYCKPLWGSKPYRLLVKATIMLYELGAQIQGKYNIRISYEDVLQSPEFDDPKDPVAKFWGDYYGAVVKTRKGNGFDRTLVNGQENSQWMK